MGSTAMSAFGGDPSPMRSPLNSIGALSFSPSPITTTPSMAMVDSTMRMAVTAALSAPSLSPLPMNRDAASAAASVTRTSSRARLRSGASGAALTGPSRTLTIVGTDGGSPVANLLSRRVCPYAGKVGVDRPAGR